MHEAMLSPIFNIFSETDICPHSLSSFSSASSTCRGSLNTLNIHENNYNYSNNNLNCNFSNYRNNNKNYQSDNLMKSSNTKRQDNKNNNGSNSNDNINNIYSNHSSTSEPDIYDKKQDFLLPSYFGSFERNYMHYYLPDSSGDSLGSEKLPLL